MTLFLTTLGLRNLVSNVPAVMVLMPLTNSSAGDHVGLTLVLVITLAGNLLIVGSIATSSWWMRHGAAAS